MLAATVIIPVTKSRRAARLALCTSNLGHNGVHPRELKGGIELCEARQGDGFRELLLEGET